MSRNQLDSHSKAHNVTSSYSTYSKPEKGTVTQSDFLHVQIDYLRQQSWEMFLPVSKLYCDRQANHIRELHAFWLPIQHYGYHLELPRVLVKSALIVFNIEGIPTIRASYSSTQPRRSLCREVFVMSQKPSVWPKALDYSKLKLILWNLSFVDLVDWAILENLRHKGFLHWGSEW